MEKYGDLIADYRKKAGMTQADLGVKLNVSAQAVSKWENGLSEPDIGTLKKMSELFNVSMDVLLGNAAPVAPVAPVAAAQPAVEKQEPKVVYKPQPPKVIIGYCDECRNPIYQGDAYEVKRHRRARHSYTTTRCKSCETKVQTARLASKRAEFITKRKRGLIWGGVAGGAVFIFLLIGMLASKKYAELYVPIVGGYAVFAFVSQCFWGDFMMDFMGFFCKSLTFPGLIFTLDLDGIIWFISVKLLFAAVGFLFSVCFFLLGVFLSLFIAMVSFPFALIACNNDD